MQGNREPGQCDPALTGLEQRIRSLDQLPVPDDLLAGASQPSREKSRAEADASVVFLRGRRRSSPRPPPSSFWARPPYSCVPETPQPLISFRPCAQHGPKSRLAIA